MTVMHGPYGPFLTVKYRAMVLQIVQMCSIADDACL